jgi:UPF0755 protein
MLKWLITKLQGVFDDFDGAQADLSEHWRPHSNRRTIIILIIAGVVAATVYTQAIQPPEAFPVRELVTVPEGSTLSEVAQALAEQHVIRSPHAFELSMRILGRARGAKAGDYIFKEPQSVWGIARRISTGAFGLEPVRIRITEGATTREMAEQLSKALPRFNADAFLLAARPQEGYLFPDTYFFLPNAHEDAVLDTLRQNFDAHIAELQPLIAASGHSLEEIITMASIIEREARVPADRRMISGVLWNRIRINMPLQVDVTFLYTVGKNTFQLTLADLRTDHPYNTYVNKGLPPGPIGSPSLDSIQAAAEPTPNPYLFYLADNTGVTHFSKTYEEHLRKKRLYLGT